MTTSLGLVPHDGVYHHLQNSNVSVSEFVKASKASQLQSTCRRLPTEDGGI